MKSLVAVAFAIITLYFIFDSGSAIKCYECNSFFQSDCADWFDNKTHNLVDCGDDVKMCRKIVQEVYYNDDWNVRYIRQCARSGEVGGDEGRQCKDRTGTYRVKVRYCHCNNQEGCNGASNIKVPTLLLAVPLLTSLGLYVSKYL
ncbi:uncharacterized protein LOC132551557 [Ylistrum balloti]|uniref:uncharacterized protein LOC132551557 n=1 Tax=Ylistrum balloti TaxID=509963 RepID=UPI002905F13C|nr:uncharacterized protein LOC132551557 [Ylistrum balloti]